MASASPSFPATDRKWPLVAAGMGVAPMTIASRGRAGHGARVAHSAIIIGLGARVVLLPAVWFMRAAPAQAVGAAGAGLPRVLHDGVDKGG